MHEDPNLAAPTLLGNDATVNMGGSLAFPLLFLSNWSYFCCHGKSRFSTATMSHTNKYSVVCGVVKALYCCAGYKLQVKARCYGGAL